MIKYRYFLVKDSEIIKEEKNTIIRGSFNYPKNSNLKKDRFFVLNGEMIDKKTLKEYIKTGVIQKIKKKEVCKILLEKLK